MNIKHKELKKKRWENRMFASFSLDINSTSETNIIIHVHVISGRKSSQGKTSQGRFRAFFDEQWENEFLY